MALPLKTAWFLDVISGAARGPGAFLARRLLWAARLPYGLGVGIRNSLFDLGWRRSHRVGVPVISVGNLTLGGTGKTPCVEWIASFLRQHEIQVAILSRGYGAQDGRNDEAMVLEENLPDVPHLQDADRVKIAQIAIEELESELLLLDDGFQHRRLARDLDIVLVDATNPWGYGYLFPRGLLREPVRSLRRAQIVMLTRCNHVSEDAACSLRQTIARYTAKALVVATEHRPLEGLPDPDYPVAAFAGIGNPEAFRQTLSSLGAEPIVFRTFPDHHAYDRADVVDLEQWAAKLPLNAVIVTTQKDWVKLRLDSLADRPLRPLRIGLHFLDGQDAFETRLLKLIHG